MRTHDRSPWGQVSYSHHPRSTPCSQPLTPALTLLLCLSPAVVHTASSGQILPLTLTHCERGRAGGHLLAYTLQCPGLQRDEAPGDLPHVQPGSPQLCCSTDLVHNQEVLYGVPVGKHHVPRVLHGLGQNLLHVLGDDAWGGTNHGQARGRPGNLGSSAKTAGASQYQAFQKEGDQRRGAAGRAKGRIPGQGRPSVAGAELQQSRGEALGGGFPGPRDTNPPEHQGTEQGH